jgi:hypothetical protein
MRSRDASDCVLLWEVFYEEGCMGFGSMEFGLVVQKFLNPIY